MSDIHATVAIALGANIGDRLAALRRAVEKLSGLMTISARSCLYETVPAYVVDQPPYLNAVIMGTTALAPTDLLQTIKRLESDIGRTPTFRYGPRVIDMDILFYGDHVMKMSELTLPHPHIAERDFVLRPLCDIAPDWAHPVTGTTAADMLAALPTSAMKNWGREW